MAFGDDFHSLTGGVLAKKSNQFYNSVFYFKTTGILDPVGSIYAFLTL
jgi:hypothetical protein